MKRPDVKLFAAAWRRLQATNGTLYAAAITFFSFLALFPMLLLAVAVLGFVLHGNPQTLHTLFDKISANVPGQVGTTLKDSINSAIDARAAVGLIGLAGVVLTGLGWIGNLRAALDAIWKRTPPKQNPIVAAAGEPGHPRRARAGRARLARRHRRVGCVQHRDPQRARPRRCPGHGHTARASSASR